MSFGEPLDILGNEVDDNGQSIDKFGRPVEIKDYFISEKGLSSDKQRDGVYAKNLADALVRSYKKNNVILSSHVMAFTAFHIINNEFKEEGYIQLINKKNKVFDIEYPVFYEKVSMLVNQIIKMNETHNVTLSDEHWDDIGVLIEEGIEKLGIYHKKPVLEIGKDNLIVSRDFRLLYFYHNRLCGYGLENLMGWHPVE
jgi:glycerol-3-phosphate O-acyltransferase